MFLSELAPDAPIPAVRKTRMTDWEELARMVQNLPINGDAHAARLVSQMRTKVLGIAAPPGKLIFIVNDEDLPL